MVAEDREINEEIESSMKTEEKDTRNKVTIKKRRKKERNKRNGRKEKSQKIYIWVLLKKILLDEYGQKFYKIFSADSKSFP